MSIQSLLSSTIKKILSEYVSFPGQAEIARSGWQAEMTFHEVKVNPSVFDKFSLPFELKHSSIDRIKLRIHWTNLFTQPTEIFVDKINMVVVPREHEISPEIQASVAENLELKQKKLDAWEELHFSSKEHRETMLSTILNNINIRINELHFCIQVPQGNGKSANLGIIIEDLVISTTDENFQISEKIDKSNTQMLWKLISIKNLLLYTKECNTGEDVCFTPIMEDEYVLRPLSASLFLTINNVERKFDSMIDPLQCDPKFKALLKIDDCLLQISKAQYDSLLDIFVSISNAQKMLPETNSIAPVSPQDKDDYVDFYVSKFRVANDVFRNLNQREKDRLSMIESREPYEVLIAWRSISIEQIQRHYNLMHIEPQIELRSQRGFLSYFSSEKAVALKNQDISTPTSDSHDEKLSDIEKWEKSLTLIDIDISLSKLGLKLMSVDDSYMETILFQISCSFSKSGIESQVRLTLADLSILTNLRDSGNARQMFSTLYGLDRQLPFFQFDFKSKSTLLEDQATLGLKLKKSRISLSNSKLCFILDFFRTPAFGNNTENTEVKNISQSKDSIRSLNSASESTAEKKFVKKESRILLDIVLEAPEFEYFLNPLSSINADVFFLNFGTLTIVGDNQSSKDFVLDFNLSEFEAFVIDSSSVRKGLIESVDNLSLRFCQSSSEGIILDISYDANFVVHVSGYRLGCITKVASQIAKAFSTNASSTQMASKAVAYAAELVDSSKHDSGSEIKLCSTTIVDNSSDPVFCCNFSTNGLIATVHSDSIYKHHASIFVFKNFDCVLSYKADGLFFVHFWLTRMEILSCYSWKPNIAFEKQESEVVAQGPPDDFINDSTRFFHFKYLLSPESSHAIFLNFNVLELRFSPPSMASLAKSLYDFLFEFMHFDDLFEPIEKSNDNAINSSPSVNPSIQEKNIGSFFKISFSLDGIQSIFLSSSNLILANIWSKDININLFSDSHNFDVIFGIGQILVEDPNTLDHKEIFSFNLGKYQKSKWNVDSRYLYWEREECQPENVGAVHINDSVNLSFHSYPKPQIGARIAATSLFINFKFLKSINDWLSCSEFSELREMFLLGNDNVSRTQDSKGSLNLQSQELLNQQSENDVKFLPVLDIIVLSFKVEAPYSSFSKSHFQGLFEGISAITSSSGLCDTIEITTKNLSICILEESMKYSEILNLPYSKLEIRKSPHEENDFEVDFRLRAWKLVLNEDHYKYLMGIYFDNFSAQPFLHQLSKLQSSLACSLPIVSLKSEDLLISLTRISGSKINNKDDLLSYYDGHGHVSGTIQIDLLTSTCPEIAFRLIGQSSLQADLSSGSLSSTFKVNDFTMALLSKTDHNRILKHILQPFSFELSSFSHFAREFDGFWTSLSGSLTPISLLISFRTLMTFMRIFENISSIMNEIQSVLTQIRHSNDELVASVTPAVYSRFWRGTLDDDKAEIFKLFDELKISPSLDQNKEIHSKSSYCIDMFFTFEGIDFVLIDDLIEDYEIPCARFTIWNIDSNFSSFEDFFSFEVSLSFRGFYHNYSLFQWEPLIESSRLSFIMDSSSGYLDKLIILRLNFLKDLNFNVTHGMIETMNQISSLLSQSKDSTLSITRIKTNQVNPYSFINSTQFDLKVTFDVSLFSVNIKADSEAHLCPPLKTLNSGKLGVSLVFPALNSELLKVDLSKIGTFKHVIVTTAFDEVKTLHCFVDVFFSSGVKNMRIRSMFCVQNKTPFVLEVFNLNLVVPSTKDIWLPIGFAEELIISNIRPHQTGSDWAWSKETPLENSNSRLLTCLHNEPSSSPNFWSAIMFRDDSSIMTHSFCITSYLTLQNLLPITVSVKFVEYDTEIINLASSQSYGFYQFENPSLISLSFSFSDPGNAEPAIWSKAYNLLSFLKKKPIDRIIISSKEFEEVSIKVQCQISQNGSISLMLYSEFWVYNLTGLEQPILISEDKNQIFRSKCDPNNYFSQTSVELNFSNLPDEKPLFFSFRASGSTIFLGLEDCSWSEPIPVRAVGSSGSIKLMSSNLEYVYELSLSVSRAPYPFLRTTCIYLTPKYFIRNDLPYPMEVIQTGSPSLFKLKPETILIISRWSNKLYDSREENEKSNDEKCIQIRIKHGLQQNGSNSVECWSEWSHSFNLNAAATFVCRLRQPKNQSSVLSRISILADESRLCMAVRPALEEEVPIRIENCSLETSIYFRQLSMYDWNKLKCYSYQLFSWDEPDMPRVISITLNPFSEGMLDQLDLNPNNFNGDLTFLGRLSRNGISLNFFGQSIGPIKVIVCSPFDTPSLIRIPLYEPSELFELLEKKKTQLQKLVDEIESRQRKSDKEIRNGSDSKPTKGIKLAITVLSARNLPPANWNRTTNAFCTIVIREKIMRSTTIKSLNPKWNDTFLFDFDTAFFNEHHLCMVKIAIFNANFLFEDDFLGGTSVILDVPSTYAIPTKGINRILRLKSYTAVEGFVPEVEIRYRWIEKIDDVYLDNAEEIMSQIEELTDQIHKIESRAKFLNKYQLGSIRRLKSDAVEKSKKTDRRSNLVDFNICVKDIVIPEEILSNFLECDIFCCVDIHRSQSGNLRGICLLAKSKMDHVPVNGSFRFIASEDESVEILFSFFSKNLSHIDYLGDIKIPLETFLSEMRIQKIKTLANGTSCTIHVLRSPIMVVEDEIPHSSLMIDLHGASISFIDRFPKELLYFGLVGLAFRYQDSLSQRTIEFSISKCQLDNQQKDCIIQSILYSTQSEISKQKPVIESSFNIPKNNLVDVIEFNYAAVLIQHLNIEIEESLIWSLIESFKEFSSREQSFLQHRDISSIIGVAPSEFISFPNSSALLLYFKVFQLHPISLNVTFLSDSQLREESLKQAWYEPLKVVFNIAGAAVGSFENLPLRFNGILIEDLFGSSESLTIPLISHYRVQALQQIYKLFGSLDIIGNPIQLINELGGGVLNFFYEPAQGLVKSPEAFGRGLARGSVNLIRTTLHGIFSSASKITGNISRGVALLSFDEDYVRTRLRKEWMRKRRKSKGFGDIILSGASDWGEGAFEGVSGLILDPWRGGSQNGLKGFVRGFGTGLIRAFSKPLVGVFDFTSRTLEGVYQSVGLVENASIYSGRLRPPRALIRYSRIEPFDLVSAKAMDIISEVDELKGKQLDASELELENFQFLVSVAEAKIILVVSSYRLVGAFYQRSNSYSEISSCFSIIFDNLVQVTAQRNYLVITRFKILDGIPKLKFHCIPCKDEEEAYDACSVLNVKLLQLLVEGSIVLNPKKSELWKNEQPIYLEQLPQRIQIDVDLMSLWRSSTHDEDMYWWNFVQRKSDSRGSNLPITERKQETFSNLFKVCRGRTLLVFGTFSLSIINLSGNNHLQEIALDSAAWREIKSTTVLQDSTFVTICLLDDRKLEIQCLDEFEAAQMKIFILHWISRFRPRIESAWIGYSEQWTNITRSFRNLLLNKGINGSILNSEMNNSYMIENLNLVPSPAYSTIFISYWRNDIHVNKTFRAQDRITL